MLKTAFLWGGRLAALILAAFIAYQGWVLAHLVYWKSTPPGSTAFMDARLEELRKIDPEARLEREWVPYSRISPNLKRALIAAEDAKFLDHEGFDWEGIQKAYEKDMRKGRLVAGGSTISQQLAKNLFLSGRRSFLRKGEESLITLMLEHVMDKRRIFEIYLNSIEWGNGIFGAQAAARHYFGTDASQLTPYQAAKLASMVPNPRFYDRHRNAPWLAKKTGIILSRMNSAQIP